MLASRRQPALNWNVGPGMSEVFERLGEIAAVLPSERWMLVGGLMVHVHATSAGILHARPTDDVDLVVELRAGSYAQAANALETIGYARKEPLDSRAPFHRFARGAEVVDLMAPEGRQVHFGARVVLSVPGSRSALERTIDHVSPTGTTMRIPDLGSALSLKGAALGTPSANRQRHSQDAVTLFACANPDGLDLSKSMRTNINRAITALSDPQAWSYANPDVRRRAVRTVLAIRPDWAVPEFVLARRLGRER